MEPDTRGLTSEQRAVFRVLLAAPAPAAVSAIAIALDLPRARCLATLRGLLDLELVEQGRTARATTWAALDPGAPMATLLRRQEQRLAEARDAAAQLCAEFRVASLTRGDEPVVGVLSGNAEVRRQVTALTSEARVSIETLDRPPYAFATGELQRAQPLLAAGVVHRTIYAAGGLVPERMETIARLAALGEHGRVLPDLPTKLILVDDVLALVPLVATEQSAESAAVVRPSGLLDALHALFDELWRRATPLPSATPGPGGDVTLDRLAVLLAAGLTDGAIQRQLDLSERTLRRRMAALYEREHASTRYQAGFLAGRRASSADPPP